MTDAIDDTDPFFNTDYDLLAEMLADAEEAVETMIQNGILPDDPNAKTTKDTIKSEGLVCSKCKEFKPYAEPNQPNGSLICYYCRTFG